MLKNVIKLETVVNGKAFTFISDDQPTSIDIKEALFHFIKFIGQIEDQAKAQQEAAKQPEENKVVDLPEDNQHV